MKKSFIMNIAKTAMPLAFCAAAYSPCTAQDSVEPKENQSQEQREEPQIPEITQEEAQKQRKQSFLESMKEFEELDNRRKAEEKKEREHETTVRVELEYFNLGKELKRNHETNSDDLGILPPGYSGTTKLKNGGALSFGPRFVEHLSDSFDATIDPALVLIACRNEKKHEYDTRSIGNHSAIFSDIFPISAKISAGIDYKLADGITIGALSSYKPMLEKWGDNRFDTDDEKGMKLHNNVTLGLRAGIQPWGNGTNSRLEFIAEKSINTNAHFYGFSFRIS